MRLCGISDLQPGMRVARDVCDDRLELVIAAGLVLDLRMIERLEILDVEDIFIEESGTEDIVPAEMVSDRTRRHAHKLLKRTFDDLLNISEMRDVASDDITTLLQYDNRYANAVKVSSFREIIHTTIEDLFQLNVEVFETPLIKCYLNRSYEHALNVTLLSLLIGRAFGYAHDELLALGTAAMLHDVGKLLHPQLANKKLSELDQADIRRLRDHPEAGALIMKRTAERASVEQAAIRQHHEQQDGRGYPAHLTGSNAPPLRLRSQQPKQIFRYAEILQVANSFDNLINGDLLVPAMTPAAAIESLVRGAGPVYNRAVVSKALELINVYPVGSMVEIKLGSVAFPTGQMGVVQRSARNSFHRPHILILWDRNGQRIAPRVLELDKNAGIEIDLI